MFFFFFVNSQCSFCKVGICGIMETTQRPREHSLVWVSVLVWYAWILHWFDFIIRYTLAGRKIHSLLGIFDSYLFSRKKIKFSEILKKTVSVCISLTISSLSRRSVFRIDFWRCVFTPRECNITDCSHYKGKKQTRKINLRSSDFERIHVIKIIVEES